jgi:hypothetical protein
MESYSYVVSLMHPKSTCIPGVDIDVRPTRASANDHGTLCHLVNPARPRAVMRNLRLNNCAAAESPCCRNVAPRRHLPLVDCNRCSQFNVVPRNDVNVPSDSRTSIPYMRCDCKSLVVV